VVGTSEEDVESDDDVALSFADAVVSSSDAVVLDVLVTWAALACAPRTGSAPPLTRTQSSASTTRKIATLVAMTPSHPGRRRMR
jgi:hypothetical protein